MPSDAKINPEIISAKDAKEKILQIYAYQDLDQVQHYLNNGGDQFPLHHFWGYDALTNHGFDNTSLHFDESDFLNKLGNIFHVGNLKQQIDCIRRSNEFDLIFDPFMKFSFVLALLKVLKIYNKPIIALAQQSYFPCKKNPLKRLREYVVRYIYYHGIDLILFINKSIYKHSNQDCENRFHQYLDSWGADHEFFRSYVNRQIAPATNDYIFSTGGALRDFHTLIKAFHNLDFNLKIVPRSDFVPAFDLPITPNVHIDYSITTGICSTGLIRKEYYNSLAVAIPLHRMKTTPFGPTGVTVLMEAMAMGKPVIATKNLAYPFDISGEGVGLVVEEGDTEGWCQAIKYLVDNPDEARMMGVRGMDLCEKRYNYSLFTTELIHKINQFMKENNKSTNSSNKAK